MATRATGLAFLLLCGCRPDVPPRPEILPVPDAAASPGPAPPRADAAAAADAVVPASDTVLPDALADAGPEMVADGAAAACGTLTKVLAPKLFSRGADPSGDPECTGVLNPERGLYAFRDLRNLDVANLRSAGFSLIYGKVLIPEYRNRDLDQALLDRLTASFASIR